MEFSPEEVLRFARWTSDYNPLHVDPAAARQTVFGQNVVHGVLSVLRSLAAAPLRGAKEASGLRSLEVDFLGAVLPGSRVQVDPGESAEGFQVSVTGSETGERLLAMVGEYGPRELADDNPREWVSRYLETTPPEAIRRPQPVERRLAELVTEIGRAHV